MVSCVFQIFVLRDHKCLFQHHLHFNSHFTCKPRLERYVSFLPPLFPKTEPLRISGNGFYRQDALCRPTNSVKALQETQSTGPTREDHPLISFSSFLHLPLDSLRWTMLLLSHRGSLMPLSCTTSQTPLPLHKIITNKKWKSIISKPKIDQLNQLSTIKCYSR